MDDIELQDALELAKTKYEVHLKKKREKSSRCRSHPYADNVHKNCYRLICVSPCSPLPIEYLPDGITPNNISNDDSNSIMHDDRDLQWINNIDMVDIKSTSEPVFQTDKTDDSNDYDSPLHPYTDMLTNSFCFRLLKSFRYSKLSQSESHRLFDLIHSALPSPNNLPISINKLLQKLELNQNFFRKTNICLLCYKEISDENRVCLSCPTSNKNNIAAIYDSDVKSILCVLLEKIGDTIRVYKNDLILNNDTSGNLDIGFAYAYQNLLHRFSNENFITALMHLDGIGLCKSNKLKMWLLSFSIIELPAKLRYQKHNMVIVSIWVSSKEPIASVWLQKSIKKLEELKLTGVIVNDQTIKLKVLGITGDSPALKIALNFISHNGYYCCYFCYLRGIHQKQKRQYPYECLHQMRTVNSFAQDATAAEQLNRNEKGHLGVSIFSNIVDINFPYGIIVDYAHVSLLRHSKSIFIELYRRLTPYVRNIVDRALIHQPFPHFFHRQMRPFNDLSFVKATEIRNILFYGILPIFHKHVSSEILGHFAMFITALRLLHGKPIFGDRTSDIAGDLLTKYYKDFSLFYDGLENFVLHLHQHFKNQYEMFGAFSHLGSFGQEALIGYVGSNRTGTRFYGDLICKNYSIDFLLHHKMEKSNQFTKIVDGPFDQEFNFDFKNNSLFQLLHSVQCTCASLDSCLTAYRRCIINSQVYHSLQYKRRQKSVSYFVRYTSTAVPNSYLFGKIIIFFKCLNSTYALIQQYPTISRFSDLFRSSSYYELLDRSINHLFFVISQQCISSYETVLASCILDNCIVFDCEDYHIATPVSSYDEHD
ncbi:unnamed protein product [Rotaria magnacalcarata]|uniref:Uncharacterized protein n=1 Tax=Rotaria magnacalcarata TaxID=392030 RepID=A0A816VAY5_9BILA|nr:unnamed protein product [Rotaria magnacalcarata]